MIRLYKDLETTKSNSFICDGKGEELYNAGKVFQILPNVGRTKKNI